MSSDSKYFLKVFFLLGGLTAGMKVVYFLLFEEVFRLASILFQAIFFGLFMAVYFTYQRKKSARNNNQFSAV